MEGDKGHKDRDVNGGCKWVGGGRWGHKWGGGWGHKWGGGGGQGCKWGGGGGRGCKWEEEEDGDVNGRRRRTGMYTIPRAGFENEYSTVLWRSFSHPWSFSHLATAPSILIQTLNNFIAI
jgi:hypothetical protein